MKTGKHYIQVFIESEDDLPRKYDFYVFGYKNGTVGGMNYYKGDEGNVLNYCLWYLVEQPQIELPSDETIKLNPCGYKGCENPHEKVYRGCDECKFNKTFQTSPTKLDQENNTK
jgi:hypothetical protein